MPDFIVASMTATQEQVDHAVSADWREPIAPKEAVVPASEEPAEEVVEVEETPEATEEIQKAETAPDSEPEPKQEDEKPVKGRGGFQKKIDKLTGEKKEAQAKAERLETELSDYRERLKAIEDSLAGKPAETKSEKVASASGVPKPLESDIGTKYKDWNEYQEALIDWKADLKIEAKLAERDQTAQQREAEDIQEARATSYREAAGEFVKDHPDFNEKVVAATKAGMKLPQPILDRIQELPNGPAVTYHLVTNPDEALALVEAEPVNGFIMLGRIAYGLELEAAKPEATKTPAKKPVSTAPPAVKPVTGNSAKTFTSLQDSSAKGTDEYIRARQAQLKEQAERRY